VRVRCSVCGSTERVIRHHTSYSPERLIHLCRSCHNKIHAGSLDIDPSEFEVAEGDVKSSVNLPRDLWRRFKAACAMQDRTMMAILEEIISRWLEEAGERERR